MILIDSRIGSVEFEKQLPKDIAQVTQLEYADFMFNGLGPNNEIWSIGVERKAIGDLISCMFDNRFTGHQLPGLQNEYDTGSKISYSAPNH